MSSLTLNQLPVSPPATLFGRADIYSAIDSALSFDRAVLLYGFPGIGKRSLAASFAARRLSSGQDVVWLSTSENDFLSLLWQILDAYQISESDSPEQSVLKVLNEHHPLIVIDSATDHDRIASFFWQYTAWKSEVLILSETAADGPWEAILVRGLDSEASRQLFSEIAQIDTETYENQLAPLIDYLNGNPFAIRLAALQIHYRAVGIAEFMEKLPPVSGTLQRLQAVIQTAFTLLHPSYQGLLLAIGASFSRGISANLLEYLLGTPTEKLCEPLIQRGFIESHTLHGISYYTLHPLIQSFAVWRLETNGTRREAHHRMLRAVARFFQDASDDLLHVEIENILNAAEYAAETDQYRLLQRILAILTPQAERIRQWGYQSRYERVREFVEKAGFQSAMAITQEIGVSENVESQFEAAMATTQETDVSGNTDVIETVEFVATAAETHPRRPKGLDEAIQAQKIEAPADEEAADEEALDGEVMQEELSLSTALITPDQHLQMAYNEAAVRHDRPEMARLAVQLGQLYLDHHEIAVALENFEQAITLYQEIGNLNSLLPVLELMATNCHQYRSSEEALSYARRGLNIAQQLGDDDTRCRFLTITGDIRARLGDTDGAMEAYKRAIKISRALEDYERTGITLGKLAAIYMDIERYREATVALSQSIALFEQIGRRDLQGRSLGNLGTALGYLGRWHEAGQRHMAALRIARALGDVEEERFQLQNLAYVSENDGHFKWALRYNQQALYLALLQDDHSAIGELTFELGRLLMNDSALIGQAVKLLEQSAVYLPQGETQRLLREAQVRLRRREEAGQPIFPVESDLLRYAGSEYPHQNSE